MLVVNDLGNEVVNADLVFAWSMGTTADGQAALIAQGMVNWQTAVVIGTKERCERALQLVRDGVKQRQHIVDLLGILGPRPEITVPQPQIIVPGNGEGRPS